MRLSTIWKLMFFVLGLASSLPLFAQSQPSQDQLDLLDQISGVGPLKFGAKLESFDASLLKKADLPFRALDKPTVYLYAKEDGITWGTLHPSAIALQFHSGQLVAIMLWFNGPEGDLIAVSNAVLDKYGPGDNSGPNIAQSIPVRGAFQARRWLGGKIEMDVAFPDKIRQGESVDDLKQGERGAVQFIDRELDKQLTAQEADAVQQQETKSHDLDKIKADL